jgi:ubiquinone/menaquinone biosynthesis C-methylase UbiE
MLVDLVRRELDGPSKLKILDLGCGPGETDSLRHGVFGELHGVDINEPNVERVARTNPWASYSSSGQGDPLPFEGQAFDRSFAIYVFHHIPVEERPRLVAEMARVTRRGGLVAIFEHNS